MARQTDRDRDISRQTDRDRDISRQTDRDRDISLTGAATSINICCNKHVFVVINVLAFAAKDVEHMFVVTKVLSRQKITLVAAPASDRDRQTDRQTDRQRQTKRLRAWLIGTLWMYFWVKHV